MLVKINNVRVFRYEVGDETIPKFVGNYPIIVGIDQSKTNTGLVVGSVYGKVILYMELSADKGSTTKFTKEIYEFLKYFLSEANIQDILIEEPVLPSIRIGAKGNVIGKPPNFKTSFTLMGIATVLRILQMDLLPNKHEDDYVIGNRVWKSKVLPPAFNKNISGWKGSKEWLQTVNPLFYTISDDVTDAYCIYLYACGLDYRSYGSFNGKFEFAISKSDEALHEIVSTCDDREELASKLEEGREFRPTSFTLHYRPDDVYVNCTIVER